MDAILLGLLSGKASLDASGKIPASQLPSYVDDVVEYDSEKDFPKSGEKGKIYVALDTNCQYRWSGSAYIEIVSQNILDQLTDLSKRIAALEELLKDFTSDSASILGVENE